MRTLTAIVLLAGNALAQNVATPSLDEQLTNAGQLLKSGRTGEYEHLLRKLIPKPEDEPIQDSSSFSSTNLHYVLWAMAGTAYLGANDYADAERVVGQRLH